MIFLQTSLKVKAYVNDILAAVLLNVKTRSVILEGFPRLGLPSLDPLKIDKMDLEQDEKSPVNIKLNFRNINLTGMSTSRVYKLSGFNRNPQSDKIELRFKTPKLQIMGPYRTEGKILLLPISGNGICNMTLGEFKFL